MFCEAGATKGAELNSAPLLCWVNLKTVSGHEDTVDHRGYWHSQSRDIEHHRATMDIYKNKISNIATLWRNKSVERTKYLALITY